MCHGEESPVTGAAAQTWYKAGSGMDVRRVERWNLARLHCPRCFAPEQSKRHPAGVRTDPWQREPRSRVKYPWKTPQKSRGPTRKKTVSGPTRSGRTPGDQACGRAGWGRQVLFPG